MAENSAQLSNPRSARVRQVSSLGRRAVRTKRGEFLVEGPQAVRELLACSPQAAVAVYSTPRAQERHPDLLDLIGANKVRLWDCNEDVLAAMADSQHPQGVLAVATPIDQPLDTVVDHLAQRGGFVAVLSHIRDPGNAGTVLRAADAFGAAGVIVSDAAVDIYNPKVVRSSAGSLFHLPVATGIPIEAAIARCQQSGAQVLAADGSGAQELPETDLHSAHAWVFGNEAWGLPRETLELCDAAVKIPIVRAESLNLAMAATVCLHASAQANRP